MVKCCWIDDGPSFPFGLYRCELIRYQQRDGRLLEVVFNTFAVGSASVAVREGGPKVAERLQVGTLVVEDEEWSGGHGVVKRIFSAGAL